MSLVHAIEMINTIFQLRDAWHRVDTNDIRSSLQHIVSMWISRRPSRVNKRIRMLHQQPNRSVPQVALIESIRLTLDCRSIMPNLLKNDDIFNFLRVDFVDCWSYS